MADDDKEANAPAEKRKSGGLKIVLLLLAALAIAGLSVGVTLFFLGKPSPADAKPDANAPPSEAELAKKTMAYLAIEPEFIVDYNQGSRQRYLRLELSVSSRDEEALEVVETHMPLLRDYLHTTLRKQDFDSLRTYQGKEKLAEELAAVVQALVQAELGRPGIEQVLYRSFVMQ